MLKFVICAKLIVRVGGNVLTTLYHVKCRTIKEFVIIFKTTGFSSYKVILISPGLFMENDLYVIKA